MICVAVTGFTIPLGEIAERLSVGCIILGNSTVKQKSIRNSFGLSRVKEVG
jgi:hypothetical protein